MSDEAEYNEALNDDDIRDINNAIQSFDEAKSPTVDYCKEALRALRDNNNWHDNIVRLDECKRICSDILDNLDHDNVDATIEYCSLFAKIPWVQGDDVIDCFGHMAKRLLKAESFAEKQRDIVCFREIIAAVRLIDRIFEARLVVATNKYHLNVLSGVTCKDTDDLESSIRQIRARTSEDDVARVLCDLVGSLTNDHYFTNTSIEEMRIHSTMLGSVIKFFADPAVVSDPEEFFRRRLEFSNSVEDAISNRPSTQDVGCMANGMIVGRSVQESRDARGTLFDSFIAAFKTVKNVIDCRFLGDPDRNSVPRLEVTLGNLTAEMEQQRLLSSATEDESMEEPTEEEVKRPDPRSSSSSSASPVNKEPHARPREPRHKEFKRPSRNLLLIERVSLGRIGKQILDVQKQIRCVMRAANRSGDVGHEFDIFDYIEDACDVKFFFSGIKFSLRNRTLTSDYRNVMRRCAEAVDKLVNGRSVGDLLATRFGPSDEEMLNDSYYKQFEYMRFACNRMIIGISGCESINEHVHATIRHIVRLITKGLSMLEKMR